MHYIKYKHIIILLLAAIALQTFGAMQKIMHAPNADLLLKISFWAIIGTILLFIIKLFGDKNTFLNR